MGQEYVRFDNVNSTSYKPLEFLFKSLILGIDGGGTNTRASIVQNGTLLGHATGGSIKRLRVGAEAAEANLRAILKDAFAQANVQRVQAP